MTICFVNVQYLAKQSWTLPYDDKPYLLADLSNQRPNMHTHAYVHRELAAENHLTDQSVPGAMLIIRHSE